jgi:hypothetical protein
MCYEYFWILIFALDNLGSWTLLKISQIKILFFTSQPGLPARRYPEGYNKKKNFRKVIIFMILCNDSREIFLFFRLIHVKLTLIFLESLYFLVFIFHL